MVVRYSSFIALLFICWGNADLCAQPIQLPFKKEAQPKPRSVAPKQAPLKEEFTLFVTYSGPANNVMLELNGKSVGLIEKGPNIVKVKPSEEGYFSLSLVTASRKKIHSREFLELENKSGGKLNIQWFDGEDFCRCLF